MNADKAWNWHLPHIMDVELTPHRDVHFKTLSDDIGIPPILAARFGHEGSPVVFF